MPRIVIQTIAGRTVEQKREIVRRITDDIVEVFDVRAAAVSILIQEAPPENTAKGGQLRVDRESAE